jgi:hypothetical protein
MIEKKLFSKGGKMNIRITLFILFLLSMPQAAQSTNGIITAHTRKQIKREIDNLETIKRHERKRFTLDQERRLKRLKQLIAKPVVPQKEYPKGSLKGSIRIE